MARCAPDALDPAIAADAAVARDAEDIRDLNEIIAEMARVVPDVTASLRVNWKLHRRIGQISPNIVMRSLYLSIMDMIETELVEVVGSNSSAPSDALHVHMRLVQAIAAGDTGAASYWGGERHRFQFGQAKPV